MTDTPKPDTSVEAVERLCEAVISASLQVEFRERVSATLRQLRAELTEAREKQTLYLANLITFAILESDKATDEGHEWDALIILDAFNASQKEQPR